MITIIVNGSSSLIPDQYIRDIKHSLKRLNLHISDNVRSALNWVPREFFLEKHDQFHAYNNYPIRIPKKQTCSAPDIYAIYLSKEIGNPLPGMNVLEVGTGSGYGVALLAFSIGEGSRIVSLERIPELHKFAKNNQNKLINYFIKEGIDHSNFNNVELIHIDATIYTSEKKFDRIFVTASAPHVPQNLLDLLVDNGLLIIPVNDKRGQYLYKIQKIGTKIIEELLMPVTFVPLIGKNGYSF